MRCPSKDVKWVVGYMSLELRDKVLGFLILRPLERRRTTYTHHRSRAWRVSACRAVLPAAATRISPEATH